MLFSLHGLAQQENPLQPDSVSTLNSSGKQIFQDINAPAKAAFYSAVLPGAGQVYNKQYWKVPIVYLALGTAGYFYLQNQKLYEKYRTAYQNRLMGRPDEFDYLDTEVLLRAQSYYRRNRDISLMVLSGIYILQIVEANVAAHLRLWNINKDLSWRPLTIISNRKIVWGVGVSWQF